MCMPAITYLTLSPAIQLPPGTRHAQVSGINISTASAKRSRSACTGLLLVGGRVEFMPGHHNPELPATAHGTCGR